MKSKEEVEKVIDEKIKPVINQITKIKEITMKLLKLPSMFSKKHKEKEKDETSIKEEIP